MEIYKYASQIASQIEQMIKGESLDEIEEKVFNVDVGKDMAADIKLFIDYKKNFIGCTYNSEPETTIKYLNVHAGLVCLTNEEGEEIEPSDKLETLGAIGTYIKNYLHE